MSDPHLSCESASADAGFIFHPWVTRGYPRFQILMVLTQPAHLNSRQPQSFGPTQQYFPPKSRNVTFGGVHLTHQSRSSLSVPIHRGLVIEFTSTLLKPMGDPKPGECDFSPAGVAVGGFGWWPRVSWVWVVAAGEFLSNPPRCHPYISFWLGLAWVNVIDVTFCAIS
jgi:hypothetical protein